MSHIASSLAALALTGAAVSGLAVTASASSAIPAAKTTVTIKADGLDLSGAVRSPRAACERDRKVVVFRIVGTRGGGDDVRFASDTTEVRNGVGVWSTGNTGMEGRFYAKVRRTAECGPDASPTVKASSLS